MAFETIYSFSNISDEIVLDFNLYTYRVYNPDTVTRFFRINGYGNELEVYPKSVYILTEGLYGLNSTSVTRLQTVASGVSFRLERELKNTAPTQPGAFTAPMAGTTIKSGETVRIAWGASSDPDGDQLTYIWEVSYNGGAFTSTGANAYINEANVVIPVSTMYTTVQFRVKARDRSAYQNDSAYRNSPIYTISKNTAPALTLNTTDNRTLYEADTLTIAGSATDADAGNVVNVKYQINGGTVRAIAAQISTGAAIPFSKSLTFKGSKLYEGTTEITGILAEGTSHTLKVWAEDDQGGKSTEVTRVFQVVANRPAVLTLSAFTPTSGQIDSDSITIAGNVSDPDGNSVTVKYKVGSGSFKDVYSGNGGPYSFAVKLSDLAVGKNTLTIQATDSYSAVSTKTLQVTKASSTTQLKTATIRYKLVPANGTAKGVVLWIQRETGDLTVSAEVSMGAVGEAENYLPMTKTVTAYVAEGIEEDEFAFESASAKAEIYLKLTITRANVSSDKGIKLISGVLS